MKTISNEERVSAAIKHLKAARDELNAVKARKASGKVSEALNMAQGLMQSMQRQRQKVSTGLLRSSMLINALSRGRDFPSDRDPDT